MSDTEGLDALQAAVRLYRAPLAEFVGLRKELAGVLRRGGEAEAARRLAALAKPSATAWAVNRLYWLRRDLYGAVRRSGARVRAAHEGDVAAGPLAQALTARREALSAALRGALEELRGAGQASGLAVQRRIQGTLEALAAGVSVEPGEGQLVRDLEPPSFDVLSGLNPALQPAISPTAVSDTDPSHEGDPPVGDAADPKGADQQARRNVLALAESDRAHRERELARAEEAERAARVRAEAAVAEIAEAENRLARARRRDEEAAIELQRTERQVAEARIALERSRRALDAARRALTGES
jgi:hypothetical protein